MANTKAFDIQALVPFNLAEDDEMARLLGQMNTPTIGLKVTYGEKVAPWPNEYGGKTAVYRMFVKGVEAVADGWIDHLLDTIKRVGRLEVAFVMDIDNNTGWENWLK